MKIELPDDLAICLLSVYQKSEFSTFKRCLHPIFIAALFTIVKIQEPKHLSVH